MTRIAYSAAALENVAAITGIQTSDSNLLAASKFVSGFPLKISVAAFAALELMVRAAILAATFPFSANKSFVDMTEATKSAAKAALDAAAAIIVTHVAEKKEDPKSEEIFETTSDYLHEAFNYVRETAKIGLAKIQKNPEASAAVIAGALVLTALYYSPPIFLSVRDTSELLEDVSDKADSVIELSREAIGQDDGLRRQGAASVEEVCKKALQLVKNNDELKRQGVAAAEKICGLGGTTSDICLAANPYEPGFFSIKLVSAIGMALTSAVALGVGVICNRQSCNSTPQDRNLDIWEGIDSTEMGEAGILPEKHERIVAYLYLTRAAVKARHLKLFEKISVEKIAKAVAQEYGLIPNHIRDITKEEVIQIIQTYDIVSAIKKPETLLSDQLFSQQEVIEILHSLTKHK